MEYSVHLIDEKGRGSYLSFRGKAEWKTKRIAVKHANDIRALIAKNKFPAVTCDIENEFGELIEVKS